MQAGWNAPSAQHFKRPNAFFGSLTWLHKTERCDRHLADIKTEPRPRRRSALLRQLVRSPGTIDAEGQIGGSNPVSTAEHARRDRGVDDGRQSALGNFAQE